MVKSFLIAGIGEFLGSGTRLLITRYILYEHIVFKAKEEGLAGATVLKGMLGYGASSVIYSYKFWEVTEKIPTLVQNVDEEKKLWTFMKSSVPRWNRCGMAVSLPLRR